jgi:hypothetical protein
LALEGVLEFVVGDDDRVLAGFSACGVALT